jgi:hypothetical protein
MTAPRPDLLAGWRVARAVPSVARGADAVATPATPQATADVASVATVASGNTYECDETETQPSGPRGWAPHPGSIPSSAAIQAAVATWPRDLRDTFEERAAIMEHGGGAKREVAERAAYADVWPGWR